MKKISLKILQGLLAVIILFFPLVVSAQGSIPVKTKTPAPTTNPTKNPATLPKAVTPSNPTSDYWGCDALKAQIEANGGGRAGELPKYCTEGAVYSKIVYWLYFILGLGAVIMLIYGGYVYMTARSNETQTKKGKTIIMYTLAGVAVGIIATAIITILLNLVVDNKIF